MKSCFEVTTLIHCCCSGSSAHPVLLIWQSQSICWRCLSPQNHEHTWLKFLCFPCRSQVLKTLSKVCTKPDPWDTYGFPPFMPVLFFLITVHTNFSVCPRSNVLPTCVHLPKYSHLQDVLSSQRRIHRVYPIFHSSLWCSSIRYFWQSRYARLLPVGQKWCTGEC